MSFTTPLNMEPTGKTRWGRPEYRLLGPLVYGVKVYDANTLLRFSERVVVPIGFVTDLASTPWGFRWLLARWPEPAALHDYLCSLSDVSRFLGDAIFRDAMCICKVPTWRRVLAFYAVRCAAVIMRKT